MHAPASKPTHVICAGAGCEAKTRAVVVGVTVVGVVVVVARACGVAIGVQRGLERGVAVV